MTAFIKNDGRIVRIIDGFRQRALTYRVRQTPQSDWTDEDYADAVNKRLKRHKRLTQILSSYFGNLQNANVLEIGCGDGVGTILLGLNPVKRAVGIDLDLRLKWRDDRGDTVRRLAGGIIGAVNGNEVPDQKLENPPAEFYRMDATATNFPAESFDIILSRSVLEHIPQVLDLYEEINRLLRPGGIVYQEIDPFYWIRGCHKRGLVDIPWAHARLTLEEYRRLVVESEGPEIADKRLNRLATLNRYSIREWKELHEKIPFQLVSWQENKSAFCEEVLNENPDVRTTLLPGLTFDDLLIERIIVALRKPA